MDPAALGGTSSDRGDEVAARRRASGRTSSRHDDEVAAQRRTSGRTSSRHDDEVAARRRTSGRTSSRHDDEVAARRRTSGRTSSRHDDEVAARRRTSGRTSSRHDDEVAARRRTSGRTSRHDDEVAARSGTVADGRTSSSHGDEVAALAAAAADSRRRGTDGDDPDLNVDYGRLTEEEIQERKALEKQAQDFLNMFYKIFNENPDTIYNLYDDQAIQIWTPYQQDLVLEVITKQTIKETWSIRLESPFNLELHCFVAHKRGDFTVIMANGICRGYGPPSNYVQTFVLNNSLLVTSDILFVFKGKPLRAPKNARPAEAPFVTGRPLRALKNSWPAEVPLVIDSNPMRRRSSRIAEQSINVPRELECKSRPRTRVADEVSKPSSSKLFELDPVIEGEPTHVKKKTVAIIYDQRMLDHRPDFYCKDDIRLIRHEKPCIVDEVPQRLSCIMDKLYADNLMERAVLVKPNFADLEDMQAMHAVDYMDFVQCLPPSTSNLEKYIGYNNDEVFCSSGTPAAVLLAAGAAIKACELVIDDDFQAAFAVVRPPGHHAGRDEAQGFCFANNVAIAASNLIRKHNIKRILVVDWDVHHGNGTQELFYSNKEVLFFSTFNNGLKYPKTGKQGAQHIGKGRGAGYNVNVPLRRSFGNSDLLFVWNELLIPLVKEFCPQIIIVSCGFDAAEGDPLGLCHVTPECYATLLHMLRVAGNGRVVLVLEGGYDLPVISNCASACVKLLTGDFEGLLEENMVIPPRSTIDLVKFLKVVLSRYWEVFKAT